MTTRDDRAFAAKVRSESSDDSELRASLKEHGWHRELPGIKDEHGAVLVGNRRLKIATEEGIEPVFRTISFGTGSEADAERLRLAILSNVGGAAFTPKDRKRIARHLYGKGEWTMQRIADALGVTKKTIARDIEGCVMMTQPHRPKGGRPRKEPTSPAPAKDATKTVADEEELLAIAGRERAIAEDMLDRGLSMDQAEKLHGVSNIVLRRIKARELGRREGLADPERALPATAQQRLDTAIRQAKIAIYAQAEREIEARVRHRCEAILKRCEQETANARRVIEKRKGAIKAAIYKLILSCLHPDRVTDPALKERYTKAFAEFTQLQLLLCDEKELPTAPSAPFPRSYEEMLRAREEVRARNSARAKAAQQKRGPSQAVH